MTTDSIVAYSAGTAHRDELRPGESITRLTETVSNQAALETVVDRLCAGSLAFGGTPWEGRFGFPSRSAIVRCVEGIREVLLPGYFGATDLRGESLHYHIGATIERVWHELEGQIARAIAVVERHDHARCQHCQGAAARVAQTLLLCLPELQALVASDVEAAFEGDPALRIKEEAIISYPGLFAATEQRIAHELYKLDVPLIPRIITEHAHSATGIDIHPGASIGQAFFIDHGTGVVIGETCRIGNRVRIYQGVTLGAKSFPVDENGVPLKGIARHPVVEDDVIIYAGATILGRITIGKGSSVGGNVWLTRSVPPGSRVTQAEPREAPFDQGAGI